MWIVRPERPQSVLDEPRFVQRVGMNSDLDVEFVGDGETCVDSGGSRSPVLVKFQTDRPARTCSRNGSGVEQLPLPRNPRFIGYSSAASSMRQCSSGPAHRWWRRFLWPALSPADHRSDAAGNGMFDLLRTDEMNMSIQGAGSNDATFTRDYLCRCADDHPDTILNQRITSVSEAHDPSSLDADVAFDDPLNSIQDQSVRDYQVERLLIRGQRRLAHAVTDHLPATKLYFTSISATFPR